MSYRDNTDNNQGRLIGLGDNINTVSSKTIKTNMLCLTAMHILLQKDKTEIK